MMVIIFYNNFRNIINTTETTHELSEDNAININTNHEAETSYDLLPMPDLDVTLHASLEHANDSELDPSFSGQPDLVLSERAGLSTYSRSRKR